MARRTEKAGTGARPCPAAPNCLVISMGTARRWARGHDRQPAGCPAAPAVAVLAPTTGQMRLRKLVPAIRSRRCSKPPGPHARSCARAIGASPTPGCTASPPINPDIPVGACRSEAEPSWFGPGRVLALVSGGPLKSRDGSARYVARAENCPADGPPATGRGTVDGIAKERRHAGTNTGVGAITGGRSFSSGSWSAWGSTVVVSARCAASASAVARRCPAELHRWI